MRLRTKNILLIATLLLPLSEARTFAQSPATITSCGRVYQSVRLANDLSTTSSVCLTVNASGITIDGAGHRITAGQMAIQWVDRSGITVKNVVSDQTVQIYGSGSRFNVVTDSVLGRVSIFRADDNVVQNSILGGLVIAGQANDPAQREVVTGNVIGRTLTNSEEKLVEIVTGTDGTKGPDGTYQCASGDHLVMNNLILGFINTSVATSEPELVYIRCGMHSTISGNTIRADKRAVGILLRDGADENLIENNDVWVGEGNQGALFIQSGSAGYHHPRNNTFQDNAFRATNGRSFWMQAGATRGNTFLGNSFRSDNGASEAVRLTDGPGVDMLFDHNTLSRGGSGTLLVFRDLGPGTNRFTNNTFKYSGGPRGIFDFDKLQSFAGYQGDNNIFSNDNGVVTFTKYGITFPGWQNTTSQDGASVEMDSMPAAP